MKRIPGTMNPERYPVLQGEFLIDVLRGIYLVTTWYSDGSVEEERVPKGPIVIPQPIYY